MDTTATRIAAGAPPTLGPTGMAQQDLFVSDTDGYHTYRIPALIVAADGTLLAFCEGRRDSRNDSGQIDLLLRASHDNGRTWEPQRIVVTEPGMTCDNPCPVLDRTTGVLWLPFCKNLADGPEQLITQGKAPRTVWLTHSLNHGVTWAEPLEITPAVKRPTWTWYATGPGHGIQLGDGRLIIPCDHREGLRRDESDPLHAHVIYSDDHGSTWQIGGEVASGSNECCIVEASGGGLYINCRDYNGHGCRAYSWSNDRGKTFFGYWWDETLREPVCQASLERCALPDGKWGYLFANPASSKRRRLTVRLSLDQCRTWGVSRLLNDGPSAYSDLAVSPDGTICCLYERGDADAYERITLARFGLDWLGYRPA